MEVGYFLDVGHANRPFQQRWVPGEPKKSFWFGLKIDRSQLVPVTTFRCPKCGYLESYAKG
jgi:hypothetical protein